VAKQSRSATRNMLSSECWCLEETTGPDGKRQGEVVKRPKPTADHYALRAMDSVTGCQTSEEFVGLLLGTALGCALSRPYANSVSETTAMKMMLLGSSQEFPWKATLEQTEERQQRKNRWMPKEGSELRAFAAERAHLTIHVPTVTEDGSTLNPPHGGYGTTPNPDRVNQKDGDGTFRHPLPGPDHCPGDRNRESGPDI
jgi:hypothetical protein